MPDYTRIGKYFDMLSTLIFMGTTAYSIYLLEKSVSEVQAGLRTLQARINIVEEDIDDIYKEQIPAIHKKFDDRTIRLINDMQDLKHKLNTSIEGTMRNSIYESMMQSEHPAVVLAQNDGNK